jgi:hypothetical protein
MNPHLGLGAKAGHLAAGVGANVLILIVVPQAACGYPGSSQTQVSTSKDPG